MTPHDPYACEKRYHDLLDRLQAVAGRVDALERNQRTVLDILREFRHLVRAVTAQLRSLDGRIEKTLARLVPLREAGERIARHFRN